MLKRFHCSVKWYTGIINKWMPGKLLRRKYPHGKFPRGEFPHVKFHRGTLPHREFPRQKIPSGKLPSIFLSFLYKRKNNFVLICVICVCHFVIINWFLSSSYELRATSLRKPFNCTKTRNYLKWLKEKLEK